MQRFSIARATTSVALAALCCVVVTSVGPAPAAAQFVCDSTTPGGAAGALVGTGGVACGTNANATGSDSSNTAVGEGADTRGGQSFNTAVGFQAMATTNSSGDSANTALGANALASGGVSTNVAIGSANVTHGLAAPNASGNISSNFAVGTGANASGSGSLDPDTLSVTSVATNIAIGFNANASGNQTSNLAIGTNSTASNNSVAYGAGASATGANSSAVGTGAQATHSNSAAFGNGATTTRANQQVFGTTSNTYTMSGIASAASRAAQSGSLQIVTTDSGGNLAGRSAADLGLASMGDIANINSRIDDLTARSNKAFTGVAMAFAMAGVPTLLPSETFAATMNWGTFQSANGLALNAAMRVGPNVQVNGGIGYGPDERIAGGRVGLRVGW